MRAFVRYLATTRPRLQSAGSVPPIKKVATEQSEKLSKPRHPVRRFFLKTTLLLSVVYGGATWLAVENDDFFDWFVEYAPFGAQAAGLLDDLQFRISAFRNRDSQEKSLATLTYLPPSSSERHTDEVAKASAKSSNVKNTAQSPKPASPKQPSGEYKLLSPQDVDPSLLSVVNAANGLISAINHGTFGKTEILNFAKTVENASQLLARQRESASKDLAAEMEKHSADIKKVTSEAMGSLADDHLIEKKRLLEIYNSRLSSEVEAMKSALLAIYNNNLAAQYIEQENEFAQRITERVEAERAGRLGKLSSLAGHINTLEKAMVTSGEALKENSHVVDYFSALGGLQKALQGEAQPILPYIEQLRSSLPKDPLVKAALASVTPEILDHGVLSASQLAARFQLIEPEIRRASLAPEDAGVAGHLTSWAASKLLVPKQGMPLGDDIESLLARTSTYLSEGRTIDAVAELNTLQGWPRRIAADWLKEGRRRGELEFLTKILAEEGRLVSISKR